MIDKVTILGIDPGDPFGVALFNGDKYISSATIKPERDNPNRYNELINLWDQYPDEDNLYLLFNPHVLVCEKLFVGKTKNSKGGQFLYQSSLTLAELRGATLSQICCKIFFEPYPQTWKAGRKDPEIKAQMQAIVNEETKLQIRESHTISIHEASAMAMAVWAWGKYKEWVINPSKGDLNG